MNNLKFFMLCLLLQSMFLEKAFSKENDLETHLGVGLSNARLKLSISRDITKNFETGLNFESGFLYLHPFKPVGIQLVPTTSFGNSIELNLKQYINDNMSENKSKSFYLNYFGGTSFPLYPITYNPNVDGNVSHYYFGLGVGKPFYFNNWGINTGLDLGLNIDNSYNSIAYTLFPRLLIGVETKF